MRVHAQQHVSQRRHGGPLGGGVEGDAPRLGDRVAGEVRVQGVEVQLGEDDVPALQPGAVGEPTPVDLLRHGPRRAQVGGVEVPAGVALGQPGEVRRQLPDQRRDVLVHVLIMARPLPGGEGRPAVPLRQAAHRSAAG